MHSLHQRQLSILRHVTNPRSFNAEPEDHGLVGLGADRLRLIGNLSLGKRVEKIRSVFSRSFEYLAHDPRVTIGEFVELFPPRTAMRIDNAIQFSAYLRHVWRDAPADPAFLPDVVALELALAVANAADTDGATSGVSRSIAGNHRLARGLQLLRCRFDIRVLFDGGVERSPPIEREVCLAVVAPVGGGQPRVFELEPGVFEIVHDLASAGDQPAASARRSALSARRLDELLQLGILEAQE